MTTKGNLDIGCPHCGEQTPVEVRVSAEVLSTGCPTCGFDPRTEVNVVLSCEKCGKAFWEVEKETS